MYWILSAIEICIWKSMVSSSSTLHQTRKQQWLCGSTGHSGHISTYKGTYRWINVIDELVSNYNGTKHSTICMKPVVVSKKNEAEVWTTLYGHDFGEHPLLVQGWRYCANIKVQ